MTWGLVVPVFVLTGIQTGAILSWTYYTFVLRFGQLSALVEVKWQLVLQALFSATVMACTQAYYIHRLWAVSPPGTECFPKADTRANEWI